jgi:hypothetical protein
MVVGLGGAVGVGAMLLGGGGPSGADSPEAVAEELAAAINADDPLAALQLVAPDEVDGITAVIEVIQGRASEFDLANLDAGGDADLTVELVSVTTASLADGVERVDVSFSGAAAFGGGLGALDGTDDDDENEVRDVEFIVVELDGGWFISPLLTFGDLVVRETDLPSPDWRALSDSVSPGTASSPEEAVRSLLERGAARDHRAVAGLLTGGEERFMRIFDPTIDELIFRLDEELAQDGAGYELSDVRAAELENGLVALDGARLEWFDYESSGSLALDRDCVTIRDGYGDSERACYTNEIVLSEQMPSDSFVFETVERDGGHRVKLVASFARNFVDLAERIDRTEIVRWFRLEVEDEPRPLSFGEPLEYAFAGEPYLVFETIVPAGSSRISAGAITDDDEQAYDERVYIGADGGWEPTRFDSDEMAALESTGGSLRIVLFNPCLESDRSRPYDCRSFENQRGVVAVHAERRVALTTPDGQSVPVEPFEVVVFPLDLPERSNVVFDAELANGERPYLQPRNAAGDMWTQEGDGSWTLDPGTWEFVVTNDSLSTTMTVSLTLRRPEALLPPTPSNISLSSPTTRFDLATGNGVPFLVDLATGDYVVVTATPESGQDIVLTVSASGGAFCGIGYDYGDQGGPSGTEVCYIDVSNGGGFTTTVFGYSDSDAYGPVTVTVSWA